MSFGSRLREARKNKELSQKELANLIGVANTAISNYEKDVSFPNTDILYKLFETLECDANFLFQDEVEKCRENISLLNDEKKLLTMYRNLNNNGKSKIMEYIFDLSENSKNLNNSNSIGNDIIEELRQDAIKLTTNIK